MAASATDPKTDPMSLRRTRGARWCVDEAVLRAEDEAVSSAWVCSIGRSLMLDESCIMFEFRLQAYHLKDTKVSG